MAHHLAELVVAAEQQDVSIADRVQIVSTILDVWAARNNYPARAPGSDLDHVFDALELLGDDQPWRFSKLNSLKTLDGLDTSIPLVGLAAKVERVSRDAVIAVLWLACEEAVANEADWVDVAERLKPAFEDDLITQARRIRERLREAVEGVESLENPVVSGKNAKIETVMRRLRSMSVELLALADRVEPRT